MKSLIFSMLCCLAALVAAGQTTDPHQPVVSRGNIPKDILTTSSEKYEREKKAIKTSKKGKKGKHDLRAKNTFSLQSNFVIDDMLQSGKVLFNDEISTYLGKVAAILETAQPLKNKNPLKIYAFRSTAVNAFATDRGEVFVTLGLLSRLENEAQLAFIVAHELAHVDEKHNLSLFIESERIDRESKRGSILKRSVSESEILEKCAFSKEQETQADKLGLARFQKTKYSLATLDKVFDVLKFANLPFSNKKFDRTLLESEHFRLPKNYWLGGVKDLEGIEDEDNDDKNDDDGDGKIDAGKFSSHPSLKSRREAFHAASAKIEGEGRSDFLVSEADFQKIRSLAQLELPAMYLHHDRLAQAIYTAGVLLESRPGDLYLKKSVLKALYLTAKFKNDGSYNYGGDYRKVQGESQQVFHLLEQLTIREAAVLALHHAWKLRLAQPDDSETRAIAADLFFELARQEVSLSDFPNEPTADTTAKSAWKNTFVGWSGSEDFKKAFKAGEERKQEYEDFAAEAKTRKFRKRERREQKKGLALGIPKVVIINPFYLKLDQRKENTVQFVQSEEGQAHFTGLIGDVSKIAGLKTELLDVSKLKEKDVEAFNDIRFLNEWFGDQVSHFDLTLTPGTEQDRVDAIAKKYGTDYFLWTGVISLREKARFPAGQIVAAIVLFYPITPFVAYNALKPKYDMLHYAILFDVKTGKRQVLKFEQFNHRDSDSMVKGHLYDTFLQIRRKR